jgi:hypothetical protein
LDYRFDISRSSLNGFIDDTNTRLFNVSGQLGIFMQRRPDEFGPFLAESLQGCAQL